MSNAPIHPHERERLESLRRYHILDTPPEKGFDDLSYLATFICRVPMASLSIVDRDREWFKSRVGLTMPQTPRSASFAAHAILRTTLLVVPDTTADDRFKDNPYVVGQPNVRFYAAAPVFSQDGMALGALCVMDREPRTLAVGQEEALRAVSRLASSLMELRRTNGDLLAAVDSMNMLSELLPMCSSCRRLRMEDGRWTGLDEYIRHHPKAAEGQGICPDCARRLYPDYIRA